MAILEAFQFDVEILDKDRLRRGIGANAMVGMLDYLDRMAEVELSEDWEEPLLRIGGLAFPGRVVCAMLGSGISTMAIVQTWDMPRPAKFRDIPGGEALPPTMADETTGVRAYSLVNAYDCSTTNLVVAEIWDRNLTDFEHDASAALPLLFQPEV